MRSHSLKPDHQSPADAGSSSPDPELPVCPRWLSPGSVQFVELVELAPSEVQLALSEVPFSEVQLAPSEVPLQSPGGSASGGISTGIKPAQTEAAAMAASACHPNPIILIRRMWPPAPSKTHLDPAVAKMATANAAPEAHPPPAKPYVLPEHSSLSGKIAH